MSVKGSWSRVRDKKAFDDNWDKIFKKYKCKFCDKIFSTEEEGNKHGVVCGMKFKIIKPDNDKRTVTDEPDNKISTCVNMQKMRDAKEIQSKDR